MFIVPIPSQISLKGRAIPAKEWVFVAAGDGSFEALQIDNKSNQRNHQKHYIAQRGEQYSFNMFSEKLSDGYVDKGDTLGHLSSSDLDQRVLNLNATLTELKASLEFQRSGSRETVVAGARSRVEYALARHAEQLKVTNRAEDLLKSGVISQQEYDIEARRERLDAIKVSIAEADLGSALSGAKSSELKLIETQIEETVAKIAMTQKLADEMILIAPFSGYLDFPFSNDTLMTLSDLNTMVIYIPVSGTLKDPLELVEEIDIVTENGSLSVDLSQFKKLRQILERDGSEFNLYRLLVENTETSIPSGKMLQVRFKLQPRTGYNMLKNLMGLS